MSKIATLSQKSTDYCVTHDLPGGDLCPPYIGDGSRWRISLRFDGYTLWQQIQRPNHAAQRRAAAATICAK
jgi:hypothetical protein